MDFPSARHRCSREASFLRLIGFRSKSVKNHLIESGMTSTLSSASTVVWTVVVRDLSGGIMLSTEVRDAVTMLVLKQRVTQQRGQPVADQRFMVATRGEQVGDDVTVAELAAEACLMRGNIL